MSMFSRDAGGSRSGRVIREPTASRLNVFFPTRFRWLTRYDLAKFHRNAGGSRNFEQRTLRTPARPVNVESDSKMPGMNLLLTQSLLSLAPASFDARIVHLFALPGKKSGEGMTARAISSRLLKDE